LHLASRPCPNTRCGTSARPPQPEGDDWIYELKFDGYRALIVKDEPRDAIGKDRCD